MSIFTKACFIGINKIRGCNVAFLAYLSSWLIYLDYWIKLHNTRKRYIIKIIHMCKNIRKQIIQQNKTSRDWEKTISAHAITTHTIHGELGSLASSGWWWHAHNNELATISEVNLFNIASFCNVFRILHMIFLSSQSLFNPPTLLWKRIPSWLCK